MLSCARARERCRAGSSSLPAVNDSTLNKREKEAKHRFLLVVVVVELQRARAHTHLLMLRDALPENNNPRALQDGLLRQWPSIGAQVQLPRDSFCGLSHCASALVCKLQTVAEA